MNFNEFRDIIGKEELSKLGITSKTKLQSHLIELEEDFRSMEDQKHAMLVDNLLSAVSCTDPSTYYLLQEAIAYGNFMTSFHALYMAPDNDKSAHTITYADFTRTIAGILFDEESYDLLFSGDEELEVYKSPARFNKAPSGKNVYTELLDVLTTAYEDKRRIDPSGCDTVINTMLSFIYSPDDGYQLMHFYTEGSLRNFFDYWLRLVVPTAVPKNAPPFAAAKTFAAPSSKDYDLYKKIQLSEILSILSFGSDNLRKMLGIEDLPSGAIEQQRLTWTVNKPLMDFGAFHNILSEAIPGYRDEAEHDLIKMEPDRKKPLKWSTLKRYKSAGSRDSSNFGHAICDTYIAFLDSHHSDATARKIIDQVAKVDYDSALLLIQSYSNNKNNPREFYTDLLRRVRNFHNTLGDYNTFEVNEAILLYYGNDLYRTLRNIIQYQDKSFETPLFDDKERDSLLTYNTFRELNGILLEYFSHPRLILDEELLDVCYWLGDPLDKHMFGKDSDLYKYLAPLTATFLWNKNISITDVSPSDIRELNGAGYSLILTGDLSYMNIGYRMMCSARALYNSVKDGLDPVTDKTLKALIHSNLATSFLQQSFKTENLYEKRVCLDLARAYDTIALETREELLQDESISGNPNKSINVKEKVALSHQNFATSCFYTGKFFDENDLSETDAKANYLDSIRHNITSVRMFLETGNKSDHIIRGIIKIFGSSAAHKQCVGVFATPEELGYSGEEAELINFLDHCIAVLEELDAEHVYTSPEDKEMNRTICSDMKAAISA